MDSKGIINIEILFCSIIVIFILIINLPLLEQNIERNMQIEENSKGRILIDSIANDINQVNSNNYGFEKKISLPNSINNQHYSILVNNNEIIIEFNNKKGKSKINPIKMVDSNNNTINGKQLFKGNTYIIKKTLVNDNQTHLINQSSILIEEISNN
ncbi:hypothetical protein [uncultured Methanobrevibacter sp.]|uniref:hypothetical protein n=1 Tax=uncultured Methanobrevibacter sp. TaxID=253161 RepID=UPI00261BC19E